MPPTRSVKQANQNELEIMCRCGMWHAKLEANYVYNTGTHSDITSLIFGRTPNLTRACTNFIACALAMFCCCLLSWLCYNFNESPKIVQNKQHEQLQSSRKTPCLCVPIQLNENCTCSCTNRTKRTVLVQHTCKSKRCSIRIHVFINVHTHTRKHTYLRWL